MAGTVMAAVYATAPWRVLTAPAQNGRPRPRAARGDDRSLLPPGLERQTRQLGGPFHSRRQPCSARVGMAEGLAHYERSVEINPDPYWLEEYGVLLLGQGRVDNAMARFRRSVAIGPGDPAAENNLAVALGRRARFDEAIAHYRKALELKHDFANAETTLPGSWRLARSIRCATPAKPSSLPSRPASLSITRPQQARRAGRRLCRSGTFCRRAVDCPAGPSRGHPTEPGSTGRRNSSQNCHVWRRHAIPPRLAGKRPAAGWPELACSAARHATLGLLGFAWRGRRSAKGILQLPSGVMSKARSKASPPPPR